MHLSPVVWVIIIVIDIMICAGCVLLCCYCFRSLVSSDLSSAAKRATSNTEPPKANYHTDG